MFLIEVPRYLEVVYNSVVSSSLSMVATDGRLVRTPHLTGHGTLCAGTTCEGFPKKNGGGVVKGMESQDLVMQREGLEKKQKNKKQWTLRELNNSRQLTKVWIELSGDSRAAICQLA